MPIYDYVCADCGRGFEELVRTGSTVSCPACGGSNLERKMSLPARPATAGKPVDFSSLGPPPGGCCGGGGCGHQH